MGSGTTIIAQSYTADEDTLTLSGTEFAVKALGVDTAEIADESVTSDKMSSGTMYLIERYTADGLTAEKSFTSLPASAKGFVVRIQGRKTTSGAAGLAITVNEITSASYDRNEIRVTGSSVTGANGVGTYFDLGLLSATDDTAVIAHIFPFGDYALMLAKSATSNDAYEQSGKIDMSGTLTSIQVKVLSAAFTSGSIIELWGLT